MDYYHVLDKKIFEESEVVNFDLRERGKTVGVRWGIYRAHTTVFNSLAELEAAGHKNGRIMPFKQEVHWRLYCHPSRDGVNHGGYSYDFDECISLEDARRKVQEYIKSYHQNMLNKQKKTTMKKIELLKRSADGSEVKTVTAVTKDNAEEWAAEKNAKIDFYGEKWWVVCPTCGHKLHKTKSKTEKAATASRANGAKGGRPKAKA